MCWVCDKSSAASISSRIYIGAGLNCKRDMIKERAMSDLCVVECCVNEPASEVHFEFINL